MEQVNNFLKNQSYKWGIVFELVHVTLFQSNIIKLNGFLLKLSWPLGCVIPFSGINPEKKQWNYYDIIN